MIPARRVGLRVGLAAVLGVALSVPSSRGGPRGATAAAATPRLVVVLVVDQMRADYLDRFAPLFAPDGGLERIRTRALRFPDARHRHATTATAPGHATLATGVDPARHGIVNNSFQLGDRFVRAGADPDARLVTRDAPGYSSAALLVPALGDWLKAARPDARVVAIAIKGRAATMLGGRAPDHCLYLDVETGDVTTSTRYEPTLPPFAAALNAERPFATLQGLRWERALSDERARAVGATPDDMPYEGRLGMAHPEEATFPHALREPEDLEYTPFGDDRMLDAAERAVRALGLGRREVPDLLLVSLSAADYIGHAYGPESVEVAEYYHWLDGRLARFLAALDAATGPDRWLLALAADHGVSPMVERLQARGLVAGRVRIAAIRDAVDAELDRWFGPDDWVRQVSPDVYLDRAVIARRGLDPALVRETAADAAAGVRGVRQAWPRERLLDARPDVPEAFLRSFHPARSGDVVVRFERHFHLDYLDVAPYVKANHATDQDYDQRIPIAFLSTAVAPGLRAEPFASVDLAPTLAAILRVPAPVGLDGVAHPIDLDPP